MKSARKIGEQIVPQIKYTTADTWQSYCLFESQWDN